MPPHIITVLNKLTLQSFIYIVIKRPDSKYFSFCGPDLQKIGGRPD